MRRTVKSIIKTISSDLEIPRPVLVLSKKITTGKTTFIILPFGILPVIKLNPNNKDIYKILIHELSHVYTAYYAGTTGHDKYFRYTYKQLVKHYKFFSLILFFARKKNLRI